MYSCENARLHKLQHGQLTIYTESEITVTLSWSQTSKTWTSASVHPPPLPITFC